MFHVKHFDLPPEKIEKLQDYVDILLKWNKRINLIGRNEEEWVWSDLIYPVYLVSKWVKNGSLIDLGAGAGIGGIVLKVINEDLKVVLVERREKKCSFLRFAGKTLGIDFDVMCRNAGPGDFSNFDYLFLRGVKLEGWHGSIARYIIYFGHPGEEWRKKEVIGGGFPRN